MNELERLLIDGAGHFGVSLDNKQVKRFMDYKTLLKQWNEKMNLTAIVDDKEIILKHFIDSLSLLPYMDINEDTKIIDVGTGAGFPAVPLKIARLDIDATLLDSLNKRLIFLNEVISNLRLEKINCVHLRAEEGGRKSELRERFDYSVARAVSGLDVLAELCLPYVKPGGFFMAMKGKDFAAEAAAAERPIELLGGKIIDIKIITIPFTEIEHSLIIIKKNRQTPAIFPRTSAQIAKSAIK